MSHLNYNHLYYFWMTQKKGSVTAAAEALFLTPQTVTGQIRLLEQRLGGRLFKRKGRQLEASELGQLIFQYADKMFSISYEMLDLVNYRKENQLLFDVGSPTPSRSAWPAASCSLLFRPMALFTCAVSNRPMSCCWSS